MGEIVPGVEGVEVQVDAMVVRNQAFVVKKMLDDCIADFAAGKCTVNECRHRLGLPEISSPDGGQPNGR